MGITKIRKHHVRHGSHSWGGGGTKIKIPLGCLNLSRGAKSSLKGHNDLHTEFHRVKNSPGYTWSELLTGYTWGNIP